MSAWRPEGACEHAAGLPAEVSPATECEGCVREGTQVMLLPTS